MADLILQNAARGSRREALQWALGAATLALLPTGGALADEAPILRAIPHSSEKLPVVGLGTAINFNSGEDAKRRADLGEVIGALVAGGGKLIDTASSYGEAEDLLGGLISAAGTRDKLFIATKIEATEAAEAKVEFQRSLQRLRVSRVDLLQLHNVRDANQSLAFLRDFKAQGLCRYVGVTSTFPRDYTAMEQVVRREKPDFMQIAYSIGDREAEARLIPAATDAGAGVLTALPFGRNSVFRVTRGKALPEWARDFDAATWGQFFLKYLIGNDGVTAVIPGTEKADHMGDNLAAGRGRIPDAATRERMLQLFSAL